MVYVLGITIYNNCTLGIIESPTFKFRYLAMISSNQTGSFTLFTVCFFYYKGRPFFYIY